jgi:hypothetical protein
MLKNILILSGVIIIIFLIIAGGVKKQERAECLKWQVEAEQYQGYYLTDWQIEQCGAHNIID